MRQPLQILHEEVTHSIRDFSEQLLSSGDARERHTLHQAGRVCTHARHLMGTLLGTGENELHCCLKAFDQRSRIVATWARSEPGDNRPFGLDDTQPVEGNTVLCALLGKADCATNWLPFNCFACNDLGAYPEHFFCTRKGWPSYYKSALVYPLNVTLKSENLHTAVGFLFFDSPRTGCFTAFPDILAHRDGGEKRSQYKDHLNKLAVFHAGAAIADMLSAAMRPFYVNAEVTELKKIPRR